MKKIIKGVIITLSSLIVILSLFFVTTNQTKTMKAASSTTGGITLSVSYSSDFEGDNVITDAAAGDSFYMRIKVKVESDINTFQTNWNFTNIWDKADYTMLIGNGTAQKDNDAIYDFLTANGYSDDDAGALADDYATDENLFFASATTSGVPTSQNAGNWGVAISSASTFNTKKRKNVLEKYVVLVHVKLHSDCTSWSAPMTIFNAGPSGSEQNYDLEHSIGISMGSQSSSTDLTTCTLQGSSESSANAINVTSNTGTGTVPYDSTSATLKLIADNGKASISDVKVDGTAASLSNNELTLNSLVAGTPKAVTFKVTSQDGKNNANYTITVNRKERDVKTLDSITFANPAGTASGVNAPTLSPAFSSSTLTGYQVSYTDSISSIDVTPTITPNSGIKSVTVNGTTYSGTAVPVALSGNSQTLTVRVTAEDDTHQDYVFTLVKKTSDLTLSIDINSNGQSIGAATVDTTNGTATGKVPYSNSSVAISVTPTKSGNTIKIDGTTGTNSTTKTFGSGDVTFNVTITDKDTGASKPYTVTISRDAPSTAKSMTSLKLYYSNTQYPLVGPANYVYNNSSNKIPYNATTVDLVPVIDGKYFTINSTTGTQYSSGSQVTHTLENTLNLANSSFTVRIYVFDEGKDKTEYQVNIYRDPADNDSTLDTTAIVFEDDKGNTYTPTFNQSDNSWSIELPYKANDLKVKATPTKNTSTMTIDGNNAPVGYFYTINVGSASTKTAIDPKTHPLVVKAQDKSTTPYNIIVSRKAADTDNTVSNIQVDNTTKNQTNIATLKADNVTYDFGELSFDTQALLITVTTNSDKATVKINGQDVSGTNKTFTYNYTVNSNTISIPVVITSEAGVGKPYTITGTRKVAAKKATATFVVSGNATGTITPTVANDIYTYVFGKNDTSASLVINKDVPADTQAIYYQADKYNTDKSTYNGGTIQPLTIGDYKNGKIYYVVVVPEAGTDYQTQYTLIFKAPDSRDSDATLSNLYLEDAVTSSSVAFTGTQTTFAQNVKIYEIEVPYDANNLTVYAVPTSSKGTVYKNNTDAAPVTNIPVSQISPGTTAPYTYVVKAENGTYGDTYTINVKRKAGVTAGIVDDIIVNGTSVSGFNSSNKGPYDVVLGSSVSLITLETKVGTNTFTPSANSVKYDGVTVTGTYTGTNPRVYTILAQPEVSGGTTMTYTVNVYTADQVFTLNNTNGINIYKTNTTTKQEDVDGNTFALPATSFTVPFDVKSVKVAVDTTSNTAVVSGSVTGTGDCNADIQLTNTGTTPNVVTITVKSQYASLNSSITNQEKTYTINIYREAPEAINTIKAFDSDYGVESFNKTSDPNVIEGPLTVTKIPENQGSVKLSITATSSKSYVQIQKTGETVSISNATLGGEEESFSVAQPNTVYTYTVFVWSEDTSLAPASYQISITTADSVNLSGDNNISDIKFYGVSSDTTTQKTPDSNNKIILEADESSGKIDIVASSNSATLLVTVGSNPTNTYTSTATVTVPVNDGASVAVKVLCKAQNGDPGTETPYTFERKAKSNDSIATSIEVDGNPVGNLLGDDTSTGVNTVTLAPGTTTATISTTTNEPNATVDITNVQGLNPGNNQRTVTVTAQDGKTKTKYTVNIYVMPEIKATDITVVNETMTPSFADNISSYEVRVKHDTEKVKVVVNVSSQSLYHVYIDDSLTLSKELTLNSTTRGNVYETIPVKIIGLDATGQEDTNYTSTYNIKVYRDEALTENYLLDIKVNGQKPDGFDKLTNTYYIRVPRTTTSVTFTSEADSPTLNVSTGATYTIDGTSGLTAGQINDKTITVESQSKVKNIYHFNIIPADIDVGYTDIELLKAANSTDLIDIDTNNAIVNYVAGDAGANGSVAYSTENAYLKISAKNANQKVTINSNPVSLQNLTYGTLEALAEGTNTYVVESMSEYAYIMKNAGLTYPNDQVLNPYTIMITRKAANNNPNLDKLEVRVGDATLKFDPTSTNIDGTGSFISNSGDSTLYISNIGNSVSQIYIFAEAIEAASVLSGDANTNKTLSTLKSAQDGYVFTYTIVSTAENGLTATYTIIIARGPISLDDDNKISGITLNDSNGTVYVSPNQTGNTVEQWIDSTEKYPSAQFGNEIVIPYGPQSITFNVDKLVGSPAKLFINGTDGFSQNNLSGSFQITISDSHYNNTFKYTLWALSENGAKGTEYVFTVKFEAPSDDSRIKLLTVDGSDVPSFSFAELNEHGTNNKTYTISAVYPFSKTNVTIYAEKNHSMATIASGATGTFALGTGVNTFPITVTAQDGSQSTYVVKITRDFQSPYITDMTLSDGKFIKEDGVTKTEFDSANAGSDTQVKEYIVKIPYSASQLTFTTQTDNATYTVTEPKSTKATITDKSASFKTPTIAAGSSMAFTFTVVSTEGKTNTYNVTVKRATELESDSSVGKITIKEVPDFEKEYDENTYTYDEKQYNFTVEHKVDKLSVEAIPTANQEGATTKIYGADNLTTGSNTVVVQTTSADGLTSTTYVIEVTRKPMEWDVNTAATNFKCDEKTNKKLYEVSMGKSQPRDVKDWTDYIVYDETDETISVTCLSDTTKDNLNQVILEVTDGITTEYVTLNLNYEADLLSQLGSSWWIWVILIADIVLLVAILISVNRDKYGKVTKKRKEI